MLSMAQPPALGFNSTSSITYNELAVGDSCHAAFVSCRTCDLCCRTCSNLNSGAAVASVALVRLRAILVNVCPSVVAIVDRRRPATTCQRLVGARRSIHIRPPSVVPS